LWDNCDAAVAAVAAVLVLLFALLKQAVLLFSQQWWLGLSIYSLVVALNIVRSD